MRPILFACAAVLLVPASAMLADQQEPEAGNADTDQLVSSHLRGQQDALQNLLPHETTVGASTCGGNCPGGKCDTCPCGTTKRIENIASWCSRYGNWNQTCCRCIMTKESGGNANAVNQNTGGSLDVGLWQINSMNWASCSGGKAPCDPTTNLQCAIKVWQWGGNSFKLWSTWRGCGSC